jgi:hypothetical protein
MNTECPDGVPHELIPRGILVDRLTGKQHATSDCPRCGTFSLEDMHADEVLQRVEVANAAKRLRLASRPRRQG